ncbi:MAG: terminase small subunit [Pseudomonadota bacterium]
MRVTGQETIASVFGVAPKTIVEWQEQGFPVAVRGGPGVPSEYETEACIAWLVEREVKKVQAERPQDRLARVQADKIEMENAERRGQLIPADQLEPKLRAAMVAAREYWRNEPVRLAREVIGKTVKEVEALLAASFDGFLVKLSRWPDAQACESGEDEE